jgi:hypothetical protein
MANSDWLAKTTAGQIAALTSKAQPVGGDYVMLNDSASSNAVKQCTLLVMPSFEARRLPVMTYASAATITVAAASGEPSTVYLTLQDGKRRSFTGTLTFNFANGAADLGLDEGSEASSTWYYMYLVPKNGDDTLLSLRASDNAPSTGPTGYTNFRHIGEFRNDSSSNILSFNQCGNMIITNSLFVESAGSGAPVDPDANYVEKSIVTVVPPTASFMQLQYAYNTAVESCAWQIFFSNDGGSNGIAYSYLNAPAGDKCIARIAKWVPCTATSQIWVKKQRDSGSSSLSWGEFGAQGWISGSI